jgi:hypothetical protein
MPPSNGARPTSWWEKGWYFRDIYYLDVPADAAGKTANLEILLYDSFSQERVPFDKGEELTITLVSIK